MFNLLSPILQSDHGILCGCIIHEVGEEDKRDVINLDSCCSAFQLTVNGEKRKRFKKRHNNGSIDHFQHSSNNV